MLKKLGYSAEVSSNSQDIATADKLILPGVGNFAHGMNKLIELDLIDTLVERVKSNNVPILGICLGMQLFCDQSEEGAGHGLAWIDADVVKFDETRMQRENKIPHMGWSDTFVTRENRLIQNENETPRFYYVHSFHLNCRDESQIIATATHGYEFVSAVENNNVVGVQFHPEKSHRFGMSVLKNFVENY